MAKNIVTIGGGTGSFTILSGLKSIKNVNLTAIVPATDSGGSTGRLIDEFGNLPTGDVRQCLVALAQDEEEQAILRKIFSYRFDKGEEGLKGHTFGNLFLTVLKEVLGDELTAIKTAEKILNTQGSIYPVTLDKGVLVAEYENGKTLESEHNIDEPTYPHDGRLKISKLSIKPAAKTYKNIQKVIADADYIIIGPGDLYTSLLANIVVKGIPEALKRSKAKIICIMNLVTKFGQTYSFTAADHIEVLKKYMGKYPDTILINNTELPKDILKKYKFQNDFPVVDDLDKYQNKINILREDLLTSEKIKTKSGDVLKRSLIRHDGLKVANIIHRVFLS